MAYNISESHIRRETLNSHAKLSYWFICSRSSLQLKGWDDISLFFNIIYLSYGLILQNTVAIYWTLNKITRTDDKNRQTLRTYYVLWIPTPPNKCVVVYCTVLYCIKDKKSTLTGPIRLSSLGKLDTWLAASCWWGWVEAAAASCWWWFWREAAAGSGWCGLLKKEMACGWWLWGDRGSWEMASGAGRPYRWGSMLLPSGAKYPFRGWGDSTARRSRSGGGR